MAAVDVAHEITGDGETVVLLHGSAGSRRHWRDLANQLSTWCRVIAPDLTGYGDSAPWPGREPFSLAAEAARVSPLTAGEPCHLVGHSYGGAVALRLAHKRPERFKSLTLIEPVAFHVLRQVGRGELALFGEVEALAASIARLVQCGDYTRAMATFVDYWSGDGSFEQLRPEVREQLASVAHKINLDFFATLTERTPLERYRSLGIPTRLVAGGWSPAPTRRIAEVLAEAIPGAGLEVVAGAGHMLPLTHKDLTAQLIAEHLSGHARGGLASAA